MQMQIILYLNFNESITISLYQNDTMARWFDHFSKLSESENFYSLTTNNYYDTDFKADINNHKAVKNSWVEILNSVDYLRSVGIKPDEIIPSVFEFDQQILNKLHRFFTANSLIYRNDPANNLTMQHLWNINEHVHRLEKFSKPEKNLRYIRKNHRLQYINIYNTTQSDHQWFEFTDDDIKHNYEYLELDDEHVVTLDQSILGKCYYQSFAENDDPSQFDCTGRLGSFGGFNIDIQKYNRKRLYLSQQFRDWCEKYSLSFYNLPLEVPIGHITKSSLSLSNFYNIKNLTLYKIEFVK